MSDNGKFPADDFPCDSFREAAVHLRRPFSPNAVRWRVLTGSTVIAYVDVRTVIDRLNLTVPHLWDARYEPWGERVDTNILWCHLTIDGRTRSDVGTGGKTEPQKSAVSDSLKRAAVHFGCGQVLYKLKQVALPLGDGSANSEGVPTLRRKNKGGAEITPEAEAWLRDTYRRWLDTERGKQFGPILDHGEEPDAIGDPSDPDASEPASPATLEIAAKRADAESAYAELKPAQRKKLPKGRFNARLNGSESAEQLDKLLSEVKELAAA